MLYINSQGVSSNFRWRLWLRVLHPEQSVLTCIIFPESGSESLCGSYGLTHQVSIFQQRSPLSLHNCKGNPVQVTNPEVPRS